MSAVFERTCPGCGITIKCAREYYRNRSIKEGATCWSCAQLGKAQSGMAAKGQCHHRAVSGFLRDPLGRLHKFHNLAQFVRDNPLLFAQKDLVYRRPKKDKPGSASRTCNATTSLYNLVSPNAARTSWKGWTVPAPCRDSTPVPSAGNLRHT